MMRPEELSSALQHFTGTTQYFGYRGLLLTDGVKFLADAAECYWLLDDIVLYRTALSLRDQPFLRWHLAVQANREAAFSVGDGHNTTFGTFKIPYTDFPLPEMALYLTDRVLMLTSEY